jgi:hypothetical protein
VRKSSAKFPASVHCHIAGHPNALSKSSVAGIG